MNWTDLRDFLDMGGYGLYVWGSMGMTAAVVVAELAMLRLRRRLLVREAEDADSADAVRERIA
ncbi:heme exporter protein CcmD [Hydrogenophaga sp.]|jgi:heme exporter protein D|uniref:heme exporter protein CcmD n=1 Tax=Hydrogenophaga sp. TaxID=1904254 RepID=UPI003F72E7BA